MRPIYLAITAGLLSLATCSRTHPTTAVEIPPPSEETVIAETSAEAASVVAFTSKPTHYCHVFPEHCSRCPEPGTCGEQPMAGACCCASGGGCVGVGLAGDCDPACDFWPCEAGYEYEDANGVPAVQCFDPPK